MNFTCADCPKKPCRFHHMDQLPKGCPTASADENEVLNMYDSEAQKLLYESTVLVNAGYGKHTRVEETMHLAYRMGWNKIGLAFCNGFSSEAAELAKILRSNGFELEAINCKACSIDKKKLGIDDSQLKGKGFEAMCNPGFQAKYLEEKGVDFAIVLGLCVGHDTEFIRQANYPITVLAVKDRALANNPVAALYCHDSYFKKLDSFIERECKKD